MNRQWLYRRIFRGFGLVFAAGIVTILFLLVQNGCSSKPDPNSPDIKAKQRQVMEQQQKGFSDSMREFRYPDGRKSPAKTPKTQQPGGASQPKDRK
jgi:hypothetical protein